MTIDEILNEDVFIEQAKQKAANAIKKQSEYNEYCRVKNLKPSERLEENMKYINTSVLNKMLWEEFDFDVFKKKIAVDSMYFNCLMENIDPSNKHVLNGMMNQYFKNICAIYKEVDLKPAFYKNVDQTILSESVEDSSLKIKGVINEFLNTNFYKKSPSKQVETLLTESVVNDIKKYVTKGIELEEATKVSTKKELVKKLLTEIAFPFSISTKIRRLQEGSDDTFDTVNLNNLMESFDNKVDKLATIISVAV